MSWVGGQIDRLFFGIGVLRADQREGGCVVAERPLGFEFYLLPVKLVER